MRITLTRALATVTLATLAACGTAAVPPAPTAALTPIAATPAPAPAIVPSVVPTARVDTAAIDAFVAKMLETYEVPGAAIALVLPDGTTYTRGYGVRDTATGALVTADTQFAIASVTKSFTALGVMLLVDEGKIDLDAPVTTYLPAFQLSDPALTPKVTVRHLLMHATGMERNNAATGNPTITRDQIVALAAQTPLVAAPGEKHIYSNINTVAAARIIELVSGQPWEEFTRERILDPLGMEHATLDTAAFQQQPDYALPHDRDLLTGMVPGALFESGAEAPAGGINASANEMLHYLQFHLGDGTIAGTRLLSATSLAELQRTQIGVEETGPVSRAALVAQDQGVPAPDSLVSNFGYGLYWYTEQFGGHQVVQHDGQAMGFSANTSFAPETGVGVVVMTNAHYAFGFVETVRSHILEELLAVEERHNTYQVVEAQLALLGMDQMTLRQPAEAVRNFTSDEAQLEALAGSYTNLAGEGPVTVTAVEGRVLRMEAQIQGFAFTLDLLPYAPDAFLVNSSPVRGYNVQFTTDADRVTILMNGMPIAQRAVQP